MTELHWFDVFPAFLSGFSVGLFTAFVIFILASYPKGHQ